ncbi:MAG TPA: hypothetical protein ENN56_02170 [Firmicutes bacterium]|nr:hypothetical protein [Bacillota bacterium]
MPHFPQEREIIRLQVRNRLAEIEASIYRDRQPITGWETVITGECRDVEQMPQGGWTPFEIVTKSGERTGALKRPIASHYRQRVLSTQWGWFDRSQWFRAMVTVPESMKGWPVVALLEPGAEALCYVNGVPTQGLDPNRSEVILTSCAEGGETYEIAIEASATPNAFDDDPIRLFKTPFLAVKDTLAWDFFWDIKVGQELIEALPEGTEKHRLADLVERSVKMVNLNSVSTIDRYHAELKTARDAYLDGRKQFEKSIDSGRVINVGHSHIDTAWLWAIRETRKKSSRTFSTVLKYMDQYPHYTYTQGQPQLYAWIEEHYPEIFEGIKKRIADGRWEANGASWVEQDSNVAGAEAIVRQYLYGRRYFQNVLGSEADVAWLPDAFGFPVTMPQILAKAGVRAFGTTKINWSQYNRFPYHTFRWRGLDGTEIFAFMPPGHYNGIVNASNARMIWNAYLQKDISGEILNTYGHGDGGGGPTQEMLENLSRLEEFSILPKMEVGNIGPHVDEAVSGVDWEQFPVYNEELLP